MRKRELEEICKKQRTKIDDLETKLNEYFDVINKTKEENRDLNLKYMILTTKHNKLLNNCLSKETEDITYNGELYRIVSIDYHKDAESVDNIVIKANHIPKQKGLVDSLGDVYKNTAKQFEKILFGDK